jgi:subtilisin family serine protease/subtilisin-like proprotein convertase family protein
MRGVLRAAGRTMGASAAEGLAEQLEPRMLLSAGPREFDPGVGMVSWKGMSLEANLSAWVLTFRTQMPKAMAESRARQVAGFLGLNPSNVSVSPLGQFAKITGTPGQVTDADGDRALARFGFLQQVEPDIQMRKLLVPNDGLFSRQWALQNTGQPFSDLVGGAVTPPVAGTVGADVRAVEAWNTTTGSDRVLIGVIDSGIDLNHPDLRDNIWRNPLEIPNNGVDDDNNGFVDDVNGWDFASSTNTQTGQDNNPQDNPGQGHGTLCSGVIGATGNNGIGITGLNWKVGLVATKVAPDGPSLGFSNFSILQSYEYFITLRQQGFNVVVTSNSYGAILPAEFDEFNSALEVAITNLTSAGTLFVASAGNDSLDNDSTLRAFPASYPNPDIVSVASTNNRDVLSGFSNFGRTTVDVGAPGSDVLTTSVGGGYQFTYGTSFSGPYVAGVLGLMSAANPFASKEQLKQALLGGVDVVAGLQNRVVTNGRVNAARSLALIAARGPIVTAITPGTFSAPVTQIQVQFNKPIDPSLLDASQIVLRRAAGDGLFNGNDVLIGLTAGNLSLSQGDRLLTISLPGGVQTPRDRYRLVLPSESIRDLSGNRLNGSVTNGTNETYEFEVVVPRGPLELNDTLATASPMILDEQGRVSAAELVIGDGEHGLRDVDIFRVYASGPALITASVLARSLPSASTLDSFLRLFDSGGNELAFNDNFEGLDSRIEFFVPNPGQYFVAVSAFPNRLYNPLIAGSGELTTNQGGYSLEVRVAAASTEPSRFSAGGLPRNIPDGGRLTSTIEINDQRSIASLSVRIDIAHTFLSDLVISLTSPRGQVIQLFNRRGGTGDNLTGTRFDDTSPVSISAGSAPFTGAFRPEVPLLSLADANAAGVWTLTVDDVRAGDAGRLLGWGLDVVLKSNASGPFELNDTSSLATDLEIVPGVSRTIRAFIGDGAFGLKDVDFYLVNADAGSTLSVTATPIAGGRLDTIVRVFDAEGNEVTADKRRGSTTSTVSLGFVAAGRYFIGISGGNTTSESLLGNDAYNPRFAGSGVDTDATGSYDLSISLAPGVSEPAQVVSGRQVSVGVNADGTLGDRESGVGLRLGTLDFLVNRGTASTFFGLSYNGLLLRNAGPGVQSDLSLQLNNESDFANRRVLSKGFTRALSVQRSISFGADDRFVVVDVTLRNTSTLTMTGVAWTEGFTPQHGRNLGSPDDRTLVNVLSNGRLATSRFVGGAFPGGATIGLGAAAGGVPFAVSFLDNGSVRDPAQVFTNPVDPDPTGEAGVFVGGLDMAIGFNVGSLAGNTSVSLRYFLFVGETPTDVTDRLATLDAGTGTGHLRADPLAPSIPAASLPYTVYYAEGFANDRSSTFLPIVNGNNLPARVVIIARYEGSAGEDVLFDSATDAGSTGNLIQGGRREGITITRPDLFAGGTSERIRSEIPGRQGVRKNTPFAIEVRSSLPVGAMLSHYDFGISTGQAFSSTLSNVWTFGEAKKGAGLNDFVVFYNPTAAALKVTLTLARAQGSAGGPVVLSQTVQGFRRGGWSLGAIGSDILPDGVYGVRLDADGVFTAALSSFDENRRAGYTSLGLSGEGALSGGTSEGQVGTGATAESIALYNPGSQPATVTVNFAFASGSSARRTVIVDPARRASIDVAALPGFPVGQPYAVTYTSTRPVVLSLTSFSPQVNSGSVLVQNAASQWLFGDGFRPVSAAGRTEEYLRLFNPTQRALPVQIEILYNNGESETFRRVLDARNVSELTVGDFITGTRRTVGTTPGVGSFYGIKVTSPVPILAFYGRFDQFFAGGFGTVGTPLGSVSAPTV